MNSALGQSESCCSASKHKRLWVLVKDTRAGTCFLKDYGQFAPLYEVVGSDLRCVCISDWQADRPDAKIVPGLDEKWKFRDEDGDNEVRVIKINERRTSRGTARAE